MRMLTAIGLAVVCACSAATSVAFAQDGNAVEVETEPDLLYDEGFVIEGEVQTPEVVVFITRGNLNKSYDFALKESFLVRIVDALEGSPF